MNSFLADKDTKNFWNTQILKGNKLIFISNIGHFGGFCCRLASKRKPQKGL